MDLERISKSERRNRRQRNGTVGGGFMGALGGAGMGLLVAGPAGAAVGAVLGAAMGASTGWAATRGAQDEADRDSLLDIEIGVHGPDLGAPGLEHPPARIGAYSREAAGAGAGSEPVPAEGPILSPPD